MFRKFRYASAICVVFTPSRTSVHLRYSELNRDRSSLQDELSKGHLKWVVVSKTIDTMRELVLQDCHVNYPEIETTLGINGIEIHWILHKHFIVEKICSSLIPLILPIIQKTACVVKEKIQKIQSLCWKLVFDITTSNGSLVYKYEPENKKL